MEKQGFIFPNSIKQCFDSRKKKPYLIMMDSPGKGNEGYKYLRGAYN